MPDSSTGNTSATEHPKEHAINSQARLTPTELLRYARHLQLPGAGSSGQLRLKSSHAVVVGCGGLGAPLSQYLTAAGVGRLTLIDNDTVELSNLQRQINFSESDVGLNKARQTKVRLGALNSNIRIDAVEQAFSAANAMQLAASADIIVDCTDNFSARYLINDACKLNNTPWLYASIHQFSGQLAFFQPNESCFRCLFPSKPTNVADCNTAGVLGVLPGILGTLQANEVLRYLLGLPVATSNKLMMVETSDMQFQNLELRQKQDCPACNPEFEWNPKSEFYQQAPQTHSNDAGVCEKHVLSPQAFAELPAETLIIDVRDSSEHSAFNIGGISVPLNGLEDWLSQQVKDAHIVFYCLSGMRSENACAQALRHGYKAESLGGGIQAYITHEQNSGH